MRRAIAGAAVTTLLGAVLGPRPALADTCKIVVANPPPGTVNSCSAQARGFVVVVGSGIVRLVVTCDGVEYYNNLIGTTEVSGVPGPCLLVLTVTTTIAPAVVAGATF